jgi:hypothetical protein
MKLQYLPVVTLLSLLAYGCGCYGPTEIIDLGRIPDSILSQVPYQDGQICSFTHSAGKVINFTAQRTSHDEFMECERCCDFAYKYQVNETILTPDYPVSKISIQLNSQDSTHYSHIIGIGRSGFYLTPGIPDLYPSDYADSLLLNGTWYTEVFSLKNSDSYWMIQDSIRPDSLYYSFHSGIIKLVMTNGEYYLKND